MVKRVLVLMGLLGMGVAAGCSEEPMAPSPQRLTVSPADGAVGVRLDAPVVLSFALPPDRVAVERSFHLLGEPSMNDSLCSDDSTMAGDMMAMMADHGMMEHMLEIHSVSGAFQWNGDRECVFSPDVAMEVNARYMIHLRAEMMNGMEGMEGMMSRVGETGSDMALHFKTLDPASHEAHH